MQNRALHLPVSETAETETFDIKAAAHGALQGKATSALAEKSSERDTSEHGSSGHAKAQRDGGQHDERPALRLVSSRNKSPRRTSPRPQHSRLQRKPDEIPTAHLPAMVDEWLEWCRLEGKSPRTAELRRVLLARLQWFLEKSGFEVCGGFELRKFFAHLMDGHTLPGGRWSNGKANRGREVLSPATLTTYYRHYSSFFNYLIEQELIETSPMVYVPRQIERADQIEPFNAEQVKALLKAAQKSRYPRRNEAIIRLLLDTGLRASELCGIKMGQIDLFEARARVLGKGGKERTVRWGREAARALRSYIREEYFAPDNYGPEDPLFLAEGGPATGRPMTRSGVRQLIMKLGRRAGLQAVRCSPHTFRHTFAILFLRAGGNLEALQEILGHSSLKTTLGYVKYARADIEQQQRQFSPGDRLGRIK